MTGLLVLALDRDTAGHLAVALHRHRETLRKHGLAEPECLAQLEETALRVVRSRHEASASVSVIGGLEDGLHERTHLSRNDICRLTGFSLATIDRWLASGKLESSRHGRARRVARADLERFLKAA